MTKHRFSLIGLSLAAGLLITPAVDAHAAAATACFRVSSVNGFRSIDNRIVYVRANGRNVFELKLFAACPGVTWSHGVALRSRGGSSVCEGTGHWVEIYTRSAGPNRKCRVSEVRKLTAEELAALPAGARP